MGLVRLFLASVVAADHWWFNMLMLPLSIGFDDTYKFGFNAGYAVTFFYVISGFLITYTLMRNYTRDASGTKSFYRNRFIRIYSLYWPVVILTFLLIAGMWHRFVTASTADELTGIFLIGMDWSIAFNPDPQTRFNAAIGGIHQAWTLGAEMSFYIVAPFLMRSWKIGAALLVISFAIRGYFVATMGTDLNDQWTYAFIGSTFGFFMLGHLVCLLGKPLQEPLLGVILLPASLAVMMLGGSYASFDTLRFWYSIILFTLSLPGLFELTKNVRWMNVAGDLSYPIYLIHTGVLIIVGPWLMRHTFSVSAFGGDRPAAYVTVAVFLATTMVAAFFVHKLIEVPVSRVMHMVLQRRKVQPA